MDKKYEKPKDMATALDCAKRDAEGKKGGYVMNERNITYCNYMTNEDWNIYLSHMDDSHKTQYRKGGGGELKEGKRPPKMASFGSSSRFIYELSSEIQGFRFEERLSTRVSRGTANVDGFLQRGTEYIFVEAKRREILYENVKEDTREAYKCVYNQIGKKYPKFEYELRNKKKTGGIPVTFRLNGTEVEHFELKQLICHYLGIVNRLVGKDHVENANVKFLYLIYNPDEVKDYLDKNYKDSILERYKFVHDFIKKNIKVFEKIFYIVLDYMVDIYNYKKSEIHFEMKLVDQCNYKKEIE